MKKVITNEYAIFFDENTGIEMLTGINGYDDPFMLEMPSMVDVGIMGHCENKCSFCYQGDIWEPNMTLDDFKFLIDIIKPYTNQVALGGRGDPNLHENFREIVEYARVNGVVPNYTTSGKNINDEMIQASKLCGAVAVSNYNKGFTYNALKRFMNANIKTNIHYVLTRQSVDQAISLLQGNDIWNEKVNRDKLNAIVFLLFKPQGRAKNLLDWIPTIKQLKQFIIETRKSRNPFKIGMDSCLVNKIVQLDKLTKQEEICAYTCEGGRMTCYITPDLRLIPCSFGNHENALSIKKKPFQDIWMNSELFTQFRNKLKVESNCCPYEKKEWYNVEIEESQM